MLTQPDICAMRVASSAAVAMSPAEAVPRVQRNRAPPISSTGSVPASVISQKRNIALVAPKRMRGAAIARKRLERRLVLVHAVAEELDRGDIGQRVHHLTGHHRAGGGARRGADADLRHVVADQHVVAGEPDRHPERQPEVDPAHHRDRADDCGDRQAEGVDRLGDRIGDRAGRLLLLLGDATGEIVVEEAQGLAEGVAVEARQHQRVEVGPEGQRVQRGAEPHQSGAKQQEESCGGEEPGPALGEKSLRAARLREVDQPADDGGRGDLGRAHRDRDGEREAEPPGRRRGAPSP